MSLAETYSRVCVGKTVSNRFPIRNGLKQGDALSPMLFNFALRIQWHPRQLEHSYLHSTRHVGVVSRVVKLLCYHTFGNCALVGYRIANTPLGCRCFIDPPTKAVSIQVFCPSKIQFSWRRFWPKLIPFRKMGGERKKLFYLWLNNCC